MFYLMLVQSKEILFDVAYKTREEARFKAMCLSGELGQDIAVIKILGALEEVPSEAIKL